MLKQGLILVIVIGIFMFLSNLRTNTNMNNNIAYLNMHSKRSLNYPEHHSNILKFALQKFHCFHIKVYLLFLTRLCSKIQ